MRHHKNNMQDVAWGVTILLILYFLIPMISGCSARKEPYVPDLHPGKTVREQYLYCQRHHEGVHLPYDPNFECGREYP